MSDWETAPSTGGWEIAPANSRWESAPTKETPKQEEGFFESGYLGKVAKAAGEGVAKLTQDSATNKAVATREEEQKQQALWEQGGKEQTPGAMESLKQMGQQVVEHPLDTAGHFITEMAKDPELLYPGLWEAMPAKMASIVAKGGTAAKLAETGVRGAAVGATAEAGSQVAKGEWDPEKTKATAAQFGLMGAGIRGVAEVGGGALSKAKSSILKDKEAPKPIDPEFEKSRMKPEESITEAIARRREEVKGQLKETAFRDSQNGNIIPSGPKHDLEMKDDPTYEQGFITKDGKFVNRKEAAKIAEKEHADKLQSPIDPKEGLHSSDFGDKGLDAIKGPHAVTDKDGNIHLNEKAIEDDFFNDFAYIFDWEGKTGAQKKEVFAKLGITKDKFKELVKTPEEYKTFVKAHEESHVKNDDHANYPRTEDGKPNLMHEDAITIEARATMDGLEAIRHSSTLAEGIEVVKTAQRDIRADIRNAEIFSKNLEKAVPEEGIRTRMTRALEGEKSYDKILTDKEKQEVLYGTGELVSGKNYKNLGLRGSLEHIDENLRLNRIPHEVTREQYQLRRDKLDIVIKHLEALPSEEHAIPYMKQVKDRLAAIGDRAVKAGLIDALRDNYVTHILDFSKSSLSKEAQQSLLDKIKNTPKDSKLVKDFTEQRKFEFLRELEDAVKGTGVVVHTDIVKIINAYEQAMQTAIAHRSMIDHFKGTNAPNGKGWIVPLSNEALKEKYVAFQGKGSRPLEGLLVHPDLADVMGFMFEQNDPSMMLRALGSISHLTKSLNTVASLFHAYNLSIASTTAAPGMMLKEIFTGGKGIRNAVDAFKHGGDEATNKLIDGFIRNGLMATTEDIQKTIIAETGKSVDKVISRFAPEGKEFKILQHATDPLDQHVLQHLNRLTWDYMHAGGKLNLAMHQFAKMKAKNPEIPDAVLQKEIASFVNNTFGGLDWLEVASQTQNQYMKAFAMKASNIRGRAWGQILLFAPDWTISTIRATTGALPKELMKPQNWKLREGIKGMYNPKTSGDLARRYVLNTAIGYLTIQNGINYALSGHNVWENKDPTRIDLGDGTSMQAAKHSMEAAEWATNPMKTLGNKLGFWPKALYVEISGHAYPSTDAPKIKPAYNGYGGLEVAKAIAIATTAMPFAVSGGIQAPEGEGLKRGIMSTIGMPIYGMTKEERSKAIAKGKLEAKKKKE